MRGLIGLVVGCALFLPGPVLADEGVSCAISPSLRCRNLQQRADLMAGEICNDSEKMIQELLVHVSAEADGTARWWSLFQVDGLTPGQCRAIAAPGNPLALQTTGSETLHFRLAQIDYGQLLPAESLNNPTSSLTDVSAEGSLVTGRFCNEGGSETDPVQLLLFAFDRNDGVIWRERLFGPPLRSGDCQTLEQSRTPRYDRPDRFSYVLLPPAVVMPPREGTLGEGLRYDNLTIRADQFSGRICQTGGSAISDLFLLFRAADPNSGRLQWDEVVLLDNLPADGCTTFRQHARHNRLPTGWSILPLQPLYRGVNQLQ